MPDSTKNRLRHARQFIDDFAERTGLTGKGGDPQRRYLWTDAFAVQTCLGLARALDDNSYHELSLKLIDQVHETLGRFHPKDEREGWISGLPEEEARKHPTAGGLRIGKELTERKEEQAMDAQLEWERDGQYFHYLTRWCNALLQAAEETGKDQYAHWAAELMLATKNFIYESGGEKRMYWKMSTDLSRPLVPSMGAHDPLEGLVCTLSALYAVPSKEEGLRPLMKAFRTMCAGQDWATTDALGIGGLLLNTLRTALLESEGATLPEPADPEKLWADSRRSLQIFAPQHNKDLPAERRLPFRECGLTLGIRALYGIEQSPKGTNLNLEALKPLLSLTTEIEDFWLESKNRSASTWTGHRDINAVTLAASLVAEKEPRVFG